jgi:hypothetical protein
MFGYALLGCRDPLPFTATDMIRLELNLLGIRGARMNDMLVVLKLLGARFEQIEC